MSTGDTSEFVRDLIGEDQAEQRVLRLRALLEDGLNSGPGREDTAEDWAELEVTATEELSRGARRKIDTNT